MATNDKVFDEGGAVYNVMSNDFNAKGDCKSGTGGTITRNMSPGPFSSTDQFKRIVVAGAGSGGAALETTIATVNGASTVTLADAAAANVSGKEFLWGTDDTTAIANALAKAGVSGSDPKGAVVYLPPAGFLANGTTPSTGVYLVRTTLRLPSNVTLCGGGDGTVIRRGAGDLAFVITCVNDADAVNIAVRDLTVDGSQRIFGYVANRPTVAIQSTVSGTARAVRRVRISSVTFRDAISAALHCDCVDGWSASDIEIVNCLVEESGGYGFVFFGNVKNVVVADSILKQTQDSAIVVRAMQGTSTVERPGNFTVSGNLVHDLTAQVSGGFAGGVSILSADDVVISGNLLHDLYAAGIRLDEAYTGQPCRNVVVNGNLIERVGVSSGHAYAHGIYANKVLMLQVAGCLINDCAKHGIHLIDAGRVSVTGNLVWRNYDAGVAIVDSEDCTVAGNTINDNGKTSPASSTPYGVLLKAVNRNCIDLVITGNRIGNSVIGESGYSQTYSLFIDDAVATYKVTDVVVDGCDLRRFGTGGGAIGGDNGANISIGSTGFDVGSTRPSAPRVGQRFFDTGLTTDIPIWYNGTQWVKADGSSA